MTASSDRVPAPFGALPYLTVRGAPDAIAFYQRVFGAEQVERLDAPDGSVVHAELRIGPAHFMLTEERPEMGALSPQALGGSATMVTFYVPDCDAVYARALEAGATVMMPLMNQFWGDRAGGVTDPFGHKWMIASHLETVTGDALQQRFQAAMAAMAGQGGCGAG